MWPKIRHIASILFPSSEESSSICAVTQFYLDWRVDEVIITADKLWTAQHPNFKMRILMKGPVFVSDDILQLEPLDSKELFNIYDGAWWCPNAVQVYFSLRMSGIINGSENNG